MMPGMKRADLEAVLSRVLTWPAEAQQEAVGTLRAIEDEWKAGDDYQPTPEQLKGIADRIGVATDDEVEARFRTSRAAARGAGREGDIEEVVL
jgi:hypothetical protein